ncbi:hypothetical protein CMO88_02220 [Candidatus Woesearchaeota archaeon]|nr:hypothetical protein [Candidatus Woesearchaeota archaeon]|tara:strand:+ start:5844 stop:6911 length:1068 start_codon:yes stop_codon:yes gene_type:complete
MSNTLVDFLEEDTADDVYYPILNKRSSIKKIPARHNVEQLALLGARLDDMVDVDDTTSRGDAHNYLERMHFEGDYDGDDEFKFHHRSGCEQNHMTLLEFWTQKRRRIKSNERRSKRKRETKLREERQQLHDAGQSLRDNILLVGDRFFLQEETELPVQLAWRFYRGNPTMNVNLERVVNLYDTYLTAKEAGKTISFRALAEYSEVGSAMTVRHILAYHGFESLVRSVDRTYSDYVKVTPDMLSLAKKLRRSPLKPMELFCLTDWPGSYSNFSKLLTNMGSRPWAQKRGSFRSRRVVDNYRIANEIYEGLDEGLSPADIGTILDLTPFTVKIYLDNEKKARKHLARVAEVNRTIFN